MTWAIDEVHVAYCREARRLRSVHADRPGRKLRAIAELSDKYDAHRPAPASPGATGRRYSADLCSPSPATSQVSEYRDLWHPERVVRRALPKTNFAEKLAAELAGDVLTYSQRQELLAEASQLGIGRFQANLLIAEAQHQAPPAVPAADRRTGRSPLVIFLAALLLELLAAVVIYRLLM